MSADPAILAAALRHRADLLNYEAAQVQVLVGVYDRALAAILADLAAVEKARAEGKPVPFATFNRLRAKRDRLRTDIAELQTLLQAGMLDALRTAGASELRHQRGLAALQATWVAAPTEAVTTAIRTPIGGATWAQRIASGLREVSGELDLRIGAALAQGSSMSRTAASLRPIIAETYRDRLVSIARTEVQRAANETAMASYEANADLVTGVEWIDTLDSRTCERCSALKGKTWQMVEGKIQGLDTPPPLHPRCRCFLAPILVSWDLVG